MASAQSLFFACCSQGILEALASTPGQLRLIQGAVAIITPRTVQGVVSLVLTEMESHKAVTMTGDSREAMTMASALSGESRCHLGLGKEGEKASYLKVRTYVTVLNNSTNEDAFIELTDGSMFYSKGVHSGTKI